MTKLKIAVIAVMMFFTCNVMNVSAWRIGFADNKVSGTDAPIERQAEDVFGSFICSQRCYSDLSFDNMSDRLNEFFLQKFNKHYLKRKDKLSALVPFLSNCTHGYVSESGDIVGSDFEDEFKQNFATVYQLIENNMPRFVGYLKDYGFCAPGTGLNATGSMNTENVCDVINKYNIFVRLLFSNPNKKVEKERMFAFANRCFEYCFGPSTWSDFNSHLNEPADCQLVKLLYSVIWHNLVGQGWKDWNSQTLADVAEKSRQGVRVVYIAGGMDIYQLLRYGVYNIDVIDPFLPSQDKYYASKYWEWLVKGRGKNNGLEDKIVFDFGGQKINLTRKKYSRDGSFLARLSTGKRRKIEKSVSDWLVSDQENKYLGTITIHRRFCQQQDFITCSKIAGLDDTECLVLIGFNELYYAFLPKELGGWGINLKRLPENFKIYAKQLRMPVDIDVLKNIRSAEDMNFKFIRLGSDPT